MRGASSLPTIRFTVLLTRAAVSVAIVLDCLCFSDTACAIHLVSAYRPGKTAEQRGR
jgi:hypothetical protein